MVLIQLICLWWIETVFTCLVKSKPVKQEVSRIVILPLNYGECSLTWITPHNRYLGMTPRVNPFLLFQLFVSFIHFPSCTFQNISHTKPFGLNLFKVIWCFRQFFFWFFLFPFEVCAKMCLFLHDLTCWLFQRTRNMIF